MKQKTYPSRIDYRWCMAWEVNGAIDYRPMRWYEKIRYLFWILSKS